MPIEFQCPICNAAIRVGENAAGKKGTCPQCKAKIRVPEAPPAPTGPPMIEFQCPRCATVIRVPHDSAGKKGPCPKCHGRLKVPEVAPAPAPFAPVPAPFAPAPTGSTSEPITAYSAAPLPVESIPPLGPEVRIGNAAATSVASALKRRNSTSKLALLVPVACLAIFAGVAFWMFKERPEKLEGNLTAERLPDGSLPPKVVDPALLNVPRRQLLPLLEFLATEPLRLTSSLMGVEFKGDRSKLEVSVRPGTDTELYRVDPHGNKALAAYLVQHATEFDKPRLKELADNVPKFLLALESFRKAKGGASEGLVEYRNSVGVATLVGPAGYQLEAVRHGEIHRCILEDAQGQLYFLLPIGTDQFEIRGRTMANGKTPFPGVYKVTVAKKTVTPQLKSGKKTAKPKAPKEEPMPESDEGEMKEKEMSEKP